MHALERIQKQHKTCHALIVGGDDVSYGRRPNDAPNWREKMLREVSLDLARTHFVGKLPYDKYIKVLQVSAAHVYLTYPFVLSWSLLEAITTGCPVVASNTAPVKEFLSEGPHSRLMDFFDVEQLKTAAVEMLGRDKESLCARPMEGREKKPINSVESALLAYRKVFGIQKYTQGKNSVYQPLNSRVNCDGLRPHAQDATRKMCLPIREDRTPDLDYGKKRRNRLLKNRSNTRPISASQKRSKFSGQMESTHPELC
jgi:glycosyltransferase involved in cell wall biosynthesis